MSAEFDVEKASNWSNIV